MNVLICTQRARAALMRALACVALAVLPGRNEAAAQDNYEIQVYGSETVPRGGTMVEVHSNYTVRGQRTTDDGTLPDEHAVHETLEVTHGFTSWFEVGTYVFTSVQGGDWQWVGSHIRPRFAVPASWGWPVGVSLSQEVGYVRRRYAADTWTWEIRPIIDQTLGRWYWSINPALERSLRGPSSANGFEFSPNAKVSYEVSSVVTAGLEYYGAFGPLTDWEPWRRSEQQLFPALDLNVGPNWELNVGVGFGLTRPTDGLLAKMILGYCVRCAR